MSYKGVTQEEIARRVYKREDNIYLKKDIICHVVEMYNDEIRKSIS